MTQLRSNPAAISNYFDDLLNGIGHRGSSFTDVDAVTHDETTDRFLFQEFKRENEPMRRGQKRVLLALTRRDFITVWCVRKRADGLLDWYDVAADVSVDREWRPERITEAEYRRRFQRWWNRDYPIRRNALSAAS